MIKKPSPTLYFWTLTTLSLILSHNKEQCLVDWNSFPFVTNEKYFHTLKLLLSHPKTCRVQTSAHFQLGFSADIDWIHFPGNFSGAFFGAHVILVFYFRSCVEILGTHTVLGISFRQFIVIICPYIIKTIHLCDIQNHFVQFYVGDSAYLA